MFYQIQLDVIFVCVFKKRLNNLLYFLSYNLSVIYIICSFILIEESFTQDIDIQKLTNI